MTGSAGLGKAVDHHEPAVGSRAVTVGAGAGRFVRPGLFEMPLEMGYVVEVDPRPPREGIGSEPGMATGERGKLNVVAGLATAVGYFGLIESPALVFLVAGSATQGLVHLGRRAKKRAGSVQAEGSRRRIYFRFAGPSKFGKRAGSEAVGPKGVIAQLMTGEAFLAVHRGIAGREGSMNPAGRPIAESVVAGAAGADLAVVQGDRTGRNQLCRVGAHLGQDQ